MSPENNSTIRESKEANSNNNLEESEELDCSIKEEQEEEAADDKDTVPQNVFENCPMCNRLFNTLDMDRHLREVHVELNIPCEYESCDKMFKTVEIMKGHITRFHEGMRRELCTSCNKQVHPGNHRMGKCKGPYTCEICFKTFTKNYGLSQHMKRAHDSGDPELCPECGLEVKDLYSHINSKHRDGSNKISEMYEKKECKICFKWLTYLQDHMNTVHGEKNFTCDECGQQFSKSQDLDVHKDRTHLGKRYCCPQCGKTIVNLKDHMRKAHQITGYKDVEQHEVTIDQSEKDLTKLDESSYEEFDQKVFAMIEWKFNTWICLKCEFNSKNKFNVRNHVEAKHIEGVLHPCPECDKYFSTRNTVASHMSTQHKRMKFSHDL